MHPRRVITITIGHLINDEGISAANRKILEQIMAAFGDINNELIDITNSIYLTKGQPIAWQFFQVTAAMLESSDDPDGNPVVRSVLTTNGLAQSDHQFNWMMSGGVRGYRIVMGPGRGVASHSIIIDRDDANMQMEKLESVVGVSERVPQNVARPYGMGGLKLQFGEWRPSGGAFQFWPSSIAVDTWVYAEQTLPMVVIT